MKLKLNKLLLCMSLSMASLGVAADNLHQVYQQAVTSDPQILQAKANRDATFEAINEQRSTLLPQLSAKITTNNGLVDEPADGWSKAGDWNGEVGLTLTQEVYVHSSWIDLSLAEKRASQSDAALASAHQGLIIRVATAYFDILAAEDNLSFVQAEKRAIERQLEQTKQRFEVGLTAITDVHEAQAQFDSSVANEILAQNQLENAFEALTEITGLSHKNLASLNTALFSPSLPAPASSNEWLTIAEENNLDLLQSRIGVDIAKESIDRTESTRLPTLKATAGLTSPYNSIQSNDDNASIGLTLSVPIYTGGRISSQIEQSRFEYVSSSQAMEQSHRGVVRNIRRSFNNVRASISSVQAFKQTVASAESALQATEAGFEVGTRTIVDVLQSTQLVYNTKKQLADARYAYILSVLNLKQAAGTLTENDLQLISQGLK